MNQTEQKNYKTKTGETINDRMLGYENISNIHLIKKQPAIFRISCINHKFLGENDLLPPFLFSAIQICNEVETIQFAYHCMNEVSFFLKDYSNIKQNQYCAGNVQRIVSVLTSKFTNHFNFFGLVNELDFEDNAIFEGRLFNVPIHEVVNNFIWRQREHMKNNKTKGVSIYKIEIEKKVEDLEETTIDMLIKKNIQIPDEIMRNEWTCNIDTPTFSENKEFIEKFI